MSERTREQGAIFRVLARTLAGLFEDEVYKTRFGIVQNLDVSEELWAAQTEKGPDVELGMSSLSHGAYTDNWCIVLLVRKEYYPGRAAKLFLLFLVMFEILSEMDSLTQN